MEQRVFQPTKVSAYRLLKETSFLICIAGWDPVTGVYAYDFESSFPYQQADVRYGITQLRGYENCSWIVRKTDASQNCKIRVHSSMIYSVESFIQASLVYYHHDLLEISPTTMESCRVMTSFDENSKELREPAISSLPSLGEEYV